MRPGRAADHSPPSSAAVMEEYSYNSTDPLGHTGPVTGSLYVYFNFLWILVYSVVCTVVLRFGIVSFMYIYSYLLCPYYCKDYCHRVTTELQ